MTHKAAPARWAAPDGPWTEPDLHLFPQDGHRYEIIDGSLHVTPPLDGSHEAAVRAVVDTLRGAAPHGWWVCARSGLRAGDSHLVPDVLVLRPRSSGAVWNHAADVALVVEVETTASRRYDRLLKPALYADARIPGYWRVEPGPELHVHELDRDGRYTRVATIKGPDPVRLSRPYPVRVCPSRWV